jgi:Mrp family chromosome partitioning ATPase
MGYGIRVVLVMNRKGGSGKSTLCRALALWYADLGQSAQHWQMRLLHQPMISSFSAAGYLIRGRPQLLPGS